MKTTSLLLLLILVASSAFAQQDFRPGYIVRSGDTLQGYVDYRGAIRSSKIASFKTSPDANVYTYSPDEIQAYGFTNEKKAYESWLVPTPERTGFERFFLHILLKGKASVYTMRDERDRDRFYFSKDNGELVELGQTSYTRKDQTSGKRYKVPDQAFQGVLGSAFVECPTMTEKRLSSVQLKANSLLKITEEYNDCIGADIHHIQPPSKIQVTMMPVISYSVSSLKPTGYHLYVDGTYESTGLGIGGGLAFNIRNPALSEKLSVQLELLYAPYRFKGEIDNVSYFGRTTDYDLTFDLDYLKLPAQLRYTLPNGKIRPFVNLGVSYSQVIRSKRVEKSHSTFHSSSSVQEREALVGIFRKGNFGLLGGVGVSYHVSEHKALFVETRYETAEGFSHLRELRLPIHSLSVMTGFTF
ncbi:outer membrane beta-barrel protein [Pontibacter sp. BAB1700]|uniref:outer membrane beta-barrel protein n=1 Tax=Pontibacter sp. BAB1700 TaxID=1144253 RepID=UPI00026BE99F|nr:outer membrane beta-barrel protein [Pontibacter sp. BAB1700]EJF08213.1 hypothetical protein O71_22164 [Pontibacter sp. BAB1700]